MIKILKYFTQAVIIYLFFLIIKIIGLKLSRKVFSKIFITFGPIFKSKKKILNKNFEIARNVIKKDPTSIEREMWSNYGMTFVEYIFLKDLRNSNSHIEISGLDIIENINKENKKVIFISGHFANFELMSMELTKRNVSLATIYRPLNNFFLNPFMEYLRRKYICKNQIKKGISGVKDALSYLSDGHSIAMMVDQRLSEGEMINFFGKPALTTTLPAQLASRFDLEIVPIYLERKGEDSFLMEIKNPINFMSKSKSEMTAEINRSLEQMIIRNPSQWIWTHNRWK